jgi:hypothetical protein
MIKFRKSPARNGGAQPPSWREQHGRNQVRRDADRLWARITSGQEGDWQRPGWTLHPGYTWEDYVRDGQPSQRQVLRRVEALDLLVSEGKLTKITGTNGMEYMINRGPGGWFR